MSDLHGLLEYSAPASIAKTSTNTDCGSANGEWPAPGLLTVRPSTGETHAVLKSWPMDGRYAARREMMLRWKRVFDVIAAGAAVAALLPLFAIVALLVRISSPGPVFFRQQREGRFGAAFDILKFRSMHVEVGDASGVDVAAGTVGRVTWIGRILRKTSIDELPQLLNVLRGDMSLVGPRPHLRDMKAAGMPYRELVTYYDLRLQMSPGLTGLAQANGLRGDASNPGLARARIDHDIAYIDNFSLLLDFKIILKTLQREFFAGSGT